jgi:hypothetical protein
VKQKADRASHTTFQSRKDSILQPKKSFRTSPDPESGRAILICEISALILADNLQLEKRSTSGSCALNRETGAD